ncbi:MAG TPA: hypothetical protein VGG19_07800 [Tepidisphaeraceae bacterium]|jgi:hypothetical protein
MNQRLGVLLAAVALSVFKISVASADSPAEIRQVQLMPDVPSPFQVPDWKQTAIGLDNLVFNTSLTGEYLPLLHLLKDKDQNVFAFGIPDYVGDLREADGRGSGITCMGAVWAATLVGIDKSRGDEDYAKLCGAFFDPRPNLQMFGNKLAAADPEKTFWYTIFPNIIAASIAERYPSETQLSEMVHQAAISWTKATTALADPSKDDAANYDHTGFNFDTMQPVDNGHWKEPDAGAGVAWLEYAAYNRWHDPAFLKAADECMRYLDQRPADQGPWYEVLMPFGAQTAVRMNAELGRHYDTSKIINWCFDLSAARPDWKVNTDRWEDVDAAGLVGGTDRCEQRGNKVGGYGFAMNTFCWAWALVPIARYDPRYAHDIGKWMLNAASAARLYYPEYHPRDRQTSADWQGDPNHYIAYEGLKYRWDDPNQPLLSTGDPLHEHWGPHTDYGLYGSVFVGVYGAIISRTNVPEILRLDLLATDSCHPKAYPSFLYFNPLKTNQNVTLDAGSTPCDLYDAVSGTFLNRHCIGSTSFSISTGTARVIILTPSDGTLSYKDGKTYLNDIVIDYRRGTESK